MNKVWILLEYIGDKSVIEIRININFLSRLFTIYLAEKSLEIIFALIVYDDRFMTIPIRMIKDYEQIYMQRNDKVVGTVSLSCVP